MPLNCKTESVDDRRAKTLTIEEASPLDTLTKTAPGSSDVKADQNSRSNPVCLEVIVTVRSLPGEKGDSNSAKPIREEGRTVIVFDGGAVLKLASSLPPGQAVIVSNPQGRDVVCRVVSPRGLPSIKGYIEIEFVEATNDFWGIHQTTVQTTVSAAPEPITTQPHTIVIEPLTEPVAPRPAAAATPEKKYVPTGNAPSFEDIAGLARMVSRPAATVKKIEPAISSSVAKTVEEPARPPFETAKPMTPSRVQQDVEIESLSSAWESTPVSGRRQSSSDSMLGNAMFSSGGSDSISSSRRPASKTPLITAGAAVFLVGLGSGWFFLHRGNTVTPSAPVAASSQPSAHPPVETANVPASTPVAPNPAVAIDHPPPTPAPSAANPAITSVSTGGVAATAPNATQSNRRTPSNGEVKQSTSPAPRSQPVVGLSMSAPTPESRNAGRLVDGSVPNIGDSIAANPMTATTSSAALPSIARTENPPAPPVVFPGASSATRSIREPKLVSSTRPTYPPAARQAKIEGDVLVTADIDASGKVMKAKAVSGPPLLRVGAEDTVRGWKYEPAMINGRPVATQVTVKLEFHLK